MLERPRNSEKSEGQNERMVLASEQVVREMAGTRGLNDAIVDHINGEIRKKLEGAHKAPVHEIAVGTFRKCVRSYYILDGEALADEYDQRLRALER